MTRFFGYGSIDMTDIFGVTDPSQVREELRPFLYAGKTGKLYLNISVKNYVEPNKYGQTHLIVASCKATEETIRICDLREYVKRQDDPDVIARNSKPEPRKHLDKLPANLHKRKSSGKPKEQPAPERKAPKKGYGSGYENSNVPF